MIKKILLGACSSFFIFGIVFSVNAQSDPYSQEVRDGMTASLLQALQATLSQLREQFPAQVPANIDELDESELVNRPQSRLACPALSRALYYRTRGQDVTELQQFLADYFDLDPEEYVTGYFGKLTETNINRLQRENGVPSVGIVGPQTRALIKRLCAGDSTGPASGVYRAPVSPVVPAAPPAVPQTDSTTVPASLYGIYEGYMNGSRFIRTEFITKANALANCELNAKNNPTATMYCVWQGSVIFSRNAPVQTTIPAATLDYASQTVGLSPFSISGSTRGVISRVYVVLLSRTYGGTLDWYSVGNLLKGAGSDTVVSNISEVRDGRWSAPFSGVPAGGYQVLIYDASCIPISGPSNCPDLNLLTSGKLLVQGNTTTSPSSIVVQSPNGGETYEAGSGKNLTISWTARGTVFGGQICTYLVDENTGKTFGFPGASFCTPAKDGYGSLTGTLIRNSGYDLAPGLYRARAVVIAPPRTDGKDSASLAIDTSDSVFKLSEPVVATQPAFCSLNVRTPQGTRDGLVGTGYYDGTGSGYVDVVEGDPITVTWSSQNASYGVGPFNDKIELNGSMTFNAPAYNQYQAGTPYVWTFVDSTGKKVPCGVMVEVRPKFPTCELKTDKTVYKFGETIMYSWTSKNATYAAFVKNDPYGKDGLMIGGDKLAAQGSGTVPASVYGNPTLTLQVHNYSNSIGSCKTSVSVQ